MQANFPSLEALIERIHEDGRIARRALDVEPYNKFRSDLFLALSVTNKHGGD